MTRRGHRPHPLRPLLPPATSRRRPAGSPRRSWWPPLRSDGGGPLGTRSSGWPRWVSPRRSDRAAAAAAAVGVSAAAAALPHGWRHPHCGGQARSWRHYPFSRALGGFAGGFPHPAPCWQPRWCVPPRLRQRRPRGCFPPRPARRPRRASGVPAAPHPSRLVGPVGGWYVVARRLAVAAATPLLTRHRRPLALPPPLPA